MAWPELGTWGRLIGTDGLVRAMVGPVDIPRLVTAFDPSLPEVLLLGHRPHRTFDPSRMSVPLTPERLDAPEPVDVISLTMDLYLPIARLNELAGEMDPAGGLLACQLRRRPQACVNLNPDWGDEPADAIAHRYRAFGLAVAVYLPHVGEPAQLTTLDDAAMDAALDRVLAP